MGHEGSTAARLRHSANIRHLHFHYFSPIHAAAAAAAATGGVIRFLVTINMRGRFQKSLPLLYIFGLEIYGMLLYWLAAMLSEL